MVAGVDYMATPAETDSFNLYSTPHPNPTHLSFIGTLDPDLFLKASVIFINTNEFYFSSLTSIYYGDYRPHLPTSKSSGLTAEYPTKFYNHYYNDNPNHTFNYSITHLGGNDYQLIIEKENGDQAHYTSQSLATKKVTKSNLSLFPNPVTNTFQIKTDAAITSITLFNLNGKKVRSFTSPQQAYHIENLPSGIYFAKITTSEGNLNQKIIKN